MSRRSTRPGRADSSARRSTGTRSRPSSSAAFGALLTTLDAVYLERGRKLTSPLAGIGLLAALVPVITLAIDGADRTLFGGAYVVDNFAWS